LKLEEKGCQAIIPYKDNRINPGDYDKETGLTQLSKNRLKYFPKL